MESSKKGDEALKEALKEVSRLTAKVSKLEMELEERTMFWELCQEHQLNGRAPTCHAKKECPFYSPINTCIDDIVQIPELADAIIGQLDHRSVLNCRRMIFFSEW